jgi:hypothetical protein
MSNLIDVDQLVEELEQAHNEWAALDRAASILEKGQTAVAEGMRRTVIEEKRGMVESKAMSIAKASPEYMAYIEEMCVARETANIAKGRIAGREWQLKTWQSRNANERARLGLL